MKSIASAPAKIILLGDHFVVHGSKAMLAAIDKRVTVTSTLTDKAIIKIKSVLGTLEVPTYVSYQEVKSEFRPFVYLAKKMINSTEWKNAKPAKGLEIEINSDIPVGVGLGSSSACCVAVTASIYGLVESNCNPNVSSWQFKKLSPEELVEISIEAEKTIFPDTSGADCAVCTYGGMIVYDKINGVEKIEDARWSKKEIWLGDEDNDMHTTGLNFIIANSMTPHSTKRSVDRVKKFKKTREEDFSDWCRYVTNIIKGLLYNMDKDSDDPERMPFGFELAGAMADNRFLLGHLPISNKIISSMISSLVRGTDDGGAALLSAKITGAGDGGCIIVLTEDIERDLTRARGVLGKDKECFSAKIDTKGVVWNTIYDEDAYE